MILLMLIALYPMGDQPTFFERYQKIENAKTYDEVIKVFPYKELIYRRLIGDNKALYMWAGDVPGERIEVTVYPDGSATVKYFHPKLPVCKTGDCDGGGN